jgi:hypothetical protein
LHAHRQHTHVLPALSHTRTPTASTLIIITLLPIIIIIIIIIIVVVTIVRPPSPARALRP